jgi:cytochrome P450
LLPFNATRIAALSFHEWGKYMNELYEKKKLEVMNAGDHDDAGMDLMAAMIRTSGQIPETANHGKADTGLTKAEILGNSFVLFLAGHETAANTIHFSMLFLAMNPEFQRKLQGKLYRQLST